METVTKKTNGQKMPLATGAMETEIAGCLVTATTSIVVCLEGTIEANPTEAACSVATVIADTMVTIAALVVNAEAVTEEDADKYSALPTSAISILET